MPREFRDLVVKEIDSKIRFTFLDREGNPVLEDVRIAIASEVLVEGDVFGALAANRFLVLDDDGTPLLFVDPGEDLKDGTLKHWRQGKSGIPADIPFSELFVGKDGGIYVGNVSNKAVKVYDNPSAAASINSNRLVISSQFLRAGTSYPVEFIAPGAFDENMPVVIDGTTMAGVYTLDNEQLDSDSWAKGVPVRLERQGNKAFFKSGGAAMSLKVIGGATRPQNPKDPTLWVNGATVSGKVEFSAGSPRTTDEGKTWLPIVESSTVNLKPLKRFDIHIPCAVPQVIRNGSWAEYPQSEAWYDGAWHKFMLELFNNGNKYAPGWFTTVPRIWDEQNNSTYAYWDGDAIGFNKGESSIFISTALWTEQPIDLTNYRNIMVKTKNGRPNDNWAERFVFAIANNRPQNGEYQSAYKQSALIGDNAVYNIDVTKESGFKYLGLFLARNYDGAIQADLSQIILT